MFIRACAGSESRLVNVENEIRIAPLSRPDFRRLRRFRQEALAPAGILPADER